MLIVTGYHQAALLLCQKKKETWVLSLNRTTIAFWFSPSVKFFSAITGLPRNYAQMNAILIYRYGALLNCFTFYYKKLISAKCAVFTYLPLDWGGLEVSFTILFRLREVQLSSGGSRRGARGAWGPPYFYPHLPFICRAGSATALYIAQLFDF